MHVPSLRSVGEHTVVLPQRSGAGFFLTHPIVPVLRGLFFTSLLWIVLAFTLYGVYTLIASS